MSEVSDIEELLKKAAHDVTHQRRMGWIRGVLAVAAAFGGASWTARGYLSQLATKEDITILEKQYTSVYETVRLHDSTQDDRLSALEPRCADASQCCIRLNDRFDRITIPRALNQR